MSEGWETLDGGRQQPEQPAQQPYHQPTGLREAREATGLHIAALAAALKVPVKKLEALEAGRFDELPDMTFARALASSACRHLKIDAAQVLDQIPHAHAPVLGGRSAGVNTPFKPDQSGQTSLAFFSRLKTPAVWISGLLLLAALGLAFLPDWSQWPGKDLIAKSEAWIAALSNPETGISEKEIVLPVATQTNAELSDAAPAADIGAEGADAADSAVADTKPATLKSEAGLGAEPVPVAPSVSVLHLEAMNDSWVEVVDGAGKVQIQRVMKMGDVMDFSAAPPYAVVLGRADAMIVKVRGQAFDVAPFARNSVARFSAK
jgi:cytoskeleton protein RodZ